MKKYLVYISLLFSLTIVSCEQVIIEEELPYDLRLVIRGLLEDGQKVDNIYIGRTLPVSVPYRESFAHLTEANAVVIMDGLFYPLRHKGNGLYVNDTLFVQRGKTYQLIAQWESKVATAETTVPIPGNVGGSTILTREVNGQNQTVIATTINPSGFESYGTTWYVSRLQGSILSESQEFGTIAQAGIEPGNTLTVLTAPVPQHIIAGDSQFLYVRLHIFDKSFLNYFKTHTSNQISDAIFGQPSANVRWNVMGDGIGMFIAKVTTTTKVL